MVSAKMCGSKSYPTPNPHPALEPSRRDWPRQLLSLNVNWREGATRVVDEVSAEAILELCRCRDAQFDRAVVEAFVEMLTSH